MKGKIDWKDAGAAFSLAVLWFTNVWREFIFSSSYNFYFDYSPALEYTAMVLNVALLALVFLALIKLSKGVPGARLKRLFQISFLAAALSAFCGLSGEIVKAISPNATVFVNPLLPSVVLAVAAGLSFRQRFRPEAISSNLQTISLFLLPFAVFVSLQLLWTWSKTVAAARPAPAKNERSVSENQKTPPSSRKVVWVIFDGFDYNALMVKRAEDAELPDIDRLLGESFVAENAFSPAFLTQVSMPALLTGKVLREAVPAAPNDITLYAEADPSVPVSLRDGNDNIIADLHESGVKIGMVGWYHPYPRIFDRQIAEGYWHSAQHAQCFDLLGCSGYLYRMSLQTIPPMTRLFPSLWFNENVNQIERHQYLSAKADELAARRDFQFLFFHFSVPHGPFIDKHGAYSKSYSDALEAVNETVRRLKATLEATGQWENTVLIISSDHFGRGKSEPQWPLTPDAMPAAGGSGIDTRIPFIVKFPGEKKRLDYKPAFNTVVTRELILAILGGEVKTPEELAGRLDHLAVAKPELIHFKPDVTSWYDAVRDKKGN